MALSPSLTKNEWDFACGTLFAISGGIGCSSILSGTRSPIVSVALACAFVRFKSFTFSLMMKRCSCVRLIVRGAGAMAGFSASCAHKTGPGRVKARLAKPAAATRRTWRRSRGRARTHSPACAPSTRRTPRSPAGGSQIKLHPNSPRSSGPLGRGCDRFRMPRLLLRCRKR